MQQINSDMTIWLRFFKDASIPAQFVQSYANKFTENRIRFDMLADIDKPLLNEMGINAIGDCLSILKHAKAINNQIEEKNKSELVSTNASTINDTNPNSKKRSEVAKRIIETYLSDPDAKPLNEKTTLSADLISRLNFNPLTKITFNNEDIIQSTSNSSSPKVIVSSTTSDDELRNKLKNKRKLDDVYEINNSDLVGLTKTIKLTNKDTTQSKGPALEYRGLLKNDPVSSFETSKIINLNPKRTSSNTNPLTLNERLKQSSNPTLTSSTGFKFENFKVETKNEQIKSKPSLFDRLKIGNGSLKSDAIVKSSQTLSKPKIIPITFDKNTNTQAKQTKSTVSQGITKRPVNKNVFSRISF